MIITIGGLIGSGKTTVAEKLAERLGFEFISPGKMMRKIAEKRGITLEELSKLAEKDRTIDRELDSMQEEAAKGNCVVDGRLSAYLLDSDIKVWLTAPLDVRSRRVAKRDGGGSEEAKKNIIEREASERKRYMKYYKIDLDDLSIYDIIVNTEKFRADEITRALIRLFGKDIL